MLEALNEAKLDWVNTDGKDNRYCLGSLFSGKDGRSVDRRDHSDVASSQIGGQAWQLVVISIRPPVFNHYIPTFLVTGSGEALEERRHKMCGCAGGCGIEISNQWHCRLLCTHSERPGRSGGTDKAEKCAPSHCPSQARERIVTGQTGRLEVVKLALGNVRFGSKADIDVCPSDVRFTSESGHSELGLFQCSNSSG